MRRRVELLLLIVVLIAADQLTKSIARETLATEAPRSYGIVTLIYTTNSGAFLSIGSSLPPEIRAAIFSGLVAVALSIAALALFRGKVQSPADEVALALIIGGGAGNLIDRVRFGGRVSDFLYMAIGPLHTGVFNVADMAITSGILWLVLSWGFTRRRRAPQSTPGGVS